MTAVSALPDLFVSIMSLPNAQAQSQGAITFKVVPSVKEEAPTKEPKVGPVLA